MRRAPHSALLLAAVLMQAGCVAFSEAPPAGRLPESVLAQPERFVLVTLRNDPAMVASRAGSTPRGYDTASVYAAGSRARSIARALARKHSLREVSAWPIAPMDVHCILFELPADTTRASALAELAREPEVQLAQPLNTFHAAASDEKTRYNDPYVDLQRSLTQMAVPAAHRWSRGKGVKVAIVDTGVSTHHPDLRGRVVGTRNFIDSDRARFESDRHGTEVAGIIAALADNREGIVGVAPEVQILAFKACWQLRIDADAAVCNSFTLAQGLAAAIEADADVINLSLAGPADELLAELVAHAVRRGIVVVGAASPAETASGFPALVPGVLAVDVARPRTSSLQTFYAPGEDVLTLTPDGGYGFASGSSLATAHVSGVVALLLSRARVLDGEGVRKLLATSSQRIATPIGEFSSINACAALAEMLSLGPCPQDSPQAVALRSAAPRAH